MFGYLRGQDGTILPTLDIVGRGDWLRNSANFKGLNNRAVSDVERGCLPFGEKIWKFRFEVKW